MAVNLEEIISELQAGFVPDDVAQLSSVVGNLPRLYEVLIEKTDQLSVWAGGTGFMDLSNDLIDLCKALDPVRLAAEDVAVNPQMMFLSGEG